MGLDSDEKRLDYIQEKIERPWDQEPLLETDKAWDAIHRCLTDGSLEVVRSSSPLGKLIVGGIQLYAHPQSYIINLIEGVELPEISTGLKRVTEEWFRARYEQLHRTDYPQAFIFRGRLRVHVALVFPEYQPSSIVPSRKDVALSLQLTSKTSAARVLALASIFPTNIVSLKVGD